MGWRGAGRNHAVQVQAPGGQHGGVSLVATDRPHRSTVGRHLDVVRPFDAGDGGHDPVGGGVDRRERSAALVGDPDGALHHAAVAGESGRRRVLVGAIVIAVEHRQATRHGEHGQRTGGESNDAHAPAPLVPILWELRRSRIGTGVGC